MIRLKKQKTKREKGKKKIRISLGSVSVCFVCLFAWLTPQFVEHLISPVFHTSTFSGPLRQSESKYDFVKAVRAAEPSRVQTSIGFNLLESLKTAASIIIEQGFQTAKLKQQ